MRVRAGRSPRLTRGRVRAWADGPLIVTRHEGQDGSPHFLLASQFPDFMPPISILKVFLFGRESYSFGEAEGRVDTITQNDMHITQDYIHGHQCQDMQWRSCTAAKSDPGDRYAR